VYEEQLLINRIKSLTGYSAELALDMAIQGATEVNDTATKVFVSHIGIQVQHKEFIFSNGYAELENPEVLLTEIRIVCPRDKLVTARTAVANAYKGFTPFPFDSNFSSIVFMEAKLLSSYSNKVNWSEYVGLVFPRFSH